MEKEPILEHVIIEPVEEITTPDGIETVVRIYGDSSKQIAQGTELLGLVTGSDIKRCDEKRDTGSSFFGFDSSRWKAPWNPTGPKKNWAPPSSQNPQEN